MEKYFYLKEELNADDIVSALSGESLLIKRFVGLIVFKTMGINGYLIDSWLMSDKENLGVYYSLDDGREFIGYILIKDIVNKFEEKELHLEIDVVRSEKPN